MKSTSEKIVSIASELYSARTSVKTILGEKKFQEAVEGFRPILARICQRDGLSQLQALKIILQDMQNNGSASIDKQIVTAACAEIIEPSLAKVERQKP